MTGEKSPDCTKCIHYFITHKADFPYGCRMLGFKSKRKPLRDVLDASSESCLFFEPRKTK